LAEGSAIQHSGADVPLKKNCMAAGCGVETVLIENPADGGVEIAEQRISDFRVNTFRQELGNHVGATAS
jgi:hypothetical protein